MPSAPRRQVPLPTDLRPLLQEGLRRCRPGDYLFPGASPGTHLSPKTLGRMVRDAAERAGVRKPVSPMVLRHSYAVHLLEAGVTIRDLQERLGHRDIETTLRYERCRLPKDATSPLDRLQPLPSAPPVRRSLGEGGCAMPSALFHEPLDIGPLLMPLPEPAISQEPAAIEHQPSAINHSLAFLQAMKARLLGPFLAIRAFRRAPNTTSPPLHSPKATTP